MSHTPTLEVVREQIEKLQKEVVETPSASGKICESGIEPPKGVLLTVQELVKPCVPGL